MASMCPPMFQSPRTDSNHPKLTFANSRFASPNFGERSSQSGLLISRVSDSAPCCRCLNRSSGGAGDNSDSEDSWRWDFGVHETVSNAIKQIDGYLSSFRDQGVADGSQVVEEWDWETWKRHFVEVDGQERIVSILKSQLASSVEREDYKDAARIKVAIAAAATNDTVGRVMSHLKKVVEEERYGDAALIRDYAGTGLVGWWAGISEDANDPYGRIIQISVEYGRYIARIYSPRQLAMASSGAPLFEIYLTDNKRGNFKQQAVYLKHKGSSQDLYLPSFKSAGSSRTLDSLDTRGNKSKLFERSSEDADSEDKDDDVGFDNILHDMIPGMKVKIEKATAPEKMDMDMISKVFEQISDDDKDEDEEKDYSSDDVDADDEIKSENDDNSDIELDSAANASGVADEDEKNQIAVQIIIGDGFMQKFLRGAHKKELLRVPAKLEKKGRTSFTFTVEEDADESLSDGTEESLQNKGSKLRTQQSIDRVKLDLMKSIGKGKIPTKILKDVGELISHTISQARNRQLLSGSTTFNRIEMSSSSDPLNGLYIGAHGPYTSEIIQMKRKFGQWKEEGNSQKQPEIEFYEYVEAVKLTGDAYVPAGQVAFRAKVGKRYQLSHKEIIPEELGVIARYRGQGRIAEPGFRDPRWVDGELVILDGKYIKGDPVIGFLYWAPEYHFWVFFNRLRLLD